MKEQFPKQSSPQVQPKLSHPSKPMQAPHSPTSLKHMRPLNQTGSEKKLSESTPETDKSSTSTKVGLTLPKSIPMVTDRARGIIAPLEDYLKIIGWYK